MFKLKPRKMVLWCVVLILGLFLGASNIRCQTDSGGFISIDCGLSSNSTTLDNSTGLTYVSDDQFIDTGVNYIVSSQYTSNLKDTLLTVRSFPKGKKSCYTLRSLNPGSRYLVRVACMYGNYDKLNKLPTFDLYLGVNYWTTVTIDSAEVVWFTEIIVVATADYMQVCLINKGFGTPFISWLDLRLLKDTIYQYVNSSQSLVYSRRYNFGANQTVRYHDDPYDRIWEIYSKNDIKAISTTAAIKTDKEFETPSVVLQTAALPSYFTTPLEILWTSDDKTNKYYIILHICEIQNLTSSRKFNIYINGLLAFESITTTSLTSDSYSYIAENNLHYNVSFRGTSTFTSPILNAIEMHIIRPITEVPTNDSDVTAINAIKANYKVDKGWSGDPCVPTTLTWSGVSCTSDSSNISRITGLTVPSSGLTGSLISDFGNLIALKKLDLSWNKLTGSMPSSMDQLTSLTSLDISGTNLTLSPGLKKRQQSGALKVINSTPSESNKKKIIIATVVVVLLVLIVGALTTILCLRKRRSYSVLKKNNNNVGDILHTRGTQYSVQSGTSSRGSYHNSIGGGDGLTNFEKQQFNFEDIKIITKNFEDKIGTGGFGSVYAGYLNDGTKVAVKQRSHASSQGVEEFLAEAKILTRVHHKHLVSLIGYCLDGDCMALVYEYMPEGTLEDKLRGKDVPKITLTWKQRLRIVYESAQGLDYLHNSCRPPLIHRDVKTNNILLNSDLEAKIADFGLSRAFESNVGTHVTMAVAGTAGYMDPDYLGAGQFRKKSDVYSFGVVLLEIVTGQPPIIMEGPFKGSLTYWVDEKLSRKDKDQMLSNEQIESVADPNMHGEYDINSIDKVIKLAENCTEQSVFKRPDMDEVAVELKACLELETFAEKTRTRSTISASQSTNQSNYPTNDNIVSDVSQNSGHEMAYMSRGNPMPSGPSAR